MQYRRKRALYVGSNGNTKIYKTPPQDIQNKVCSICKEDKLIEKFGYTTLKGKKYYKDSCKECIWSLKEKKQSKKKNDSSTESEEEIPEPITILESNVSVSNCSQGELHCRKSLEARFPEHEFKKVRLDKFINPDTGARLELDLYNEELNLAIEYNGRQHYEFVPFFHRNDQEEFEKQKARDIIKEGYCDIFEIKLIIVPSLKIF